MKRNHAKAVKVITLVIISFFLLLLVYGSLRLLRPNVSPLDTINRESSDPLFKAVQEVIRVNNREHKDIIVCFYYNQGGSVDCSVLRKKFSGYEILCLSGPLPVGSTKLDQNRRSTDIDKGKGGKFLWGILYDHSISKVVLGNHEGEIVEAEDLKLWYYMGDSQTDIHDVKFIR